MREIKQKKISVSFLEHYIGKRWGGGMGGRFQTGNALVFCRETPPAYGERPRTRLKHPVGTFRPLIAPLEDVNLSCELVPQDATQSHSQLPKVADKGKQRRTSL